MSFLFGKISLSLFSLLLNWTKTCSTFHPNLHWDVCLNMSLYYLCILSPYSPPHALFSLNRSLNSRCALSNGNAFGGTHPYLSVQHSATSQAHRLYRWIHPEQIHSPCKQCKSSSSSLLLSWSPVMQNISSAMSLYKRTQNPPQQTGTTCIV